MKFFITPYLAFCLFFIFQAPASAEAPPLRIALKGEPSSLDPHQKKVIWDQFVAYTLFDTLTKYSKRMRSMPSLAVSWSNPDPLTWVVKIKEGVRFHNGDPLTTEDIVFSFDRIRNKHKNYASTFANISSYSAMDAHTLKITTKRPYNSFHQFNNIFIVPKKHIKRVGDEAFARHPIGSGQYRYVSGDTKEIILRANEDYWGTHGDIPDVVIRHTPRDKQFVALKNGAIDMAPNLLVPEFIELENDPQFKTYVGHSNLYHYLGMDVSAQRPPEVTDLSGTPLDTNPFHDPDVRLAVAKTIDMEAINATVFNNRAFPASQLGNSGVFGFNPDIKTVEKDVEEAKALMQKAGYEDGFAVTLRTPLGARESVGNVIAEQLKALNIRVTVVAVKDKEFWQELMKERHGYSFFIGGFSIGQSVEHSLVNLFATRRDTGEGRLNFFHYSNPEADRLLTEAGGAQDTEEKQLILQKTNLLIMQDRPAIPLYSMPQLYGLSRRVDWNPTFTSQVRVGDVKFVKEPTFTEKIIKLFW